ncbi:MAG: phosphoribosyl-ATP diphosphatase [Hadesarchaea archaeon]|nr:phosphoribosyl-ATP diphosphatase [Hadesarchaea archaeon]
MTTEILDEVFRVIKDRRENPKKESYVSNLLAKGEESIIDKIKEESGELVEAVREEGKPEIIHESADTIFHIMVLLAARNIEFEEVMEELEERRKPR